MDFDIAIKMYDPRKPYEVNAKVEEAYRITGANLELDLSEAPRSARVIAHEFAAVFLDGDDLTLDKYQGSDSFKSEDKYLIVLYVNKSAPGERVEELVIALTEKFGVPETADSR